jgi:DNA polymerase/3'-5' exonuclease PolX
MSHGTQMTRHQAEGYIDTLRALGSELHPCGSYRRGKALVGDLDVAVLTPDFGHYVAAAVDALGADLVRGGEAMAVLHVGDHQIDLYRTEPRYLGAMLLFLTGSGEHNRKMRVKAKFSGKKLNQYGLWSLDGECLAAATETEIFERLNLKYKQPEER